MGELRLDESLGSLLGQVSPGDGEHLLCGRRTVRPDNGALDGDVLVENSSRCTVRLSTPAVSMKPALRDLRPCVPVKNVMLPPGS
jgi:hypothetical protein